MRLCILSAIVTLFWLQAFLQQQRTASIEGIVVRSGTDVPIQRVQVKLTGRGETLVLTDSEGKFAFRDVAPGASYRLSFALNGFVRKEYGQRSTFGGGITFRLDAGQVMKDLIVSMTPTGNVDGRITDEQGQPMEGIQVRLMRQSYSAQGELHFQVVGTARTNDRGQYRLYWVSPGRYSVSAEPLRFQGDPVSTNITERTGYVGSYYPGTIDSSRAVLLDIKPGLDLGNIDWSLYPTRAESQPYHIRGRVIARDGQPPSGSVSISVSKRIAGGSETSSSTLRGSDGTFDIPGVTPGTYWVGAATNVAGLAERLSAQTSVVVSDRDVDGITLTIIPQFNISGRLRTEGFSVETLFTSGIRAALEWFGARPPYEATPVSEIMSDTFTLFRLSPGPYRLSVFPLAPDYYVKEARLGQSDILGQTIEIAGPVAGFLDVVISNRSGLIEGTVVDARRQPVANIEAVLIPEALRNRVDLYKRATADSNGRFTIQGIPPGIYTLFAWENLDPYAYFDPEVVRQAESQGKVVRVGELSKEVVEIRSIP
jgi:protocatechuate 3,4-dioxygenase beta subunit